MEDDVQVTHGSKFSRHRAPTVKSLAPTGMGTDIKLYHHRQCLKNPGTDTSRCLESRNVRKRRRERRKERKGKRERERERERKTKTKVYCCD